MNPFPISTSRSHSFMMGTNHLFLRCGQSTGMADIRRDGRVVRCFPIAEPLMALSQSVSPPSLGCHWLNFMRRKYADFTGTFTDQG